jgi:hypothetical protein
MSYNNFAGDNALSRKTIERKRGEKGATTPTRSVEKEKDPVREQGEDYRKLTATIQVEKQTMESLVNTKLMPQTKFEEDVNSIFAIPFPQYCGCTLITTPDRSKMTLTIYFEDRNDLVWKEGAIKVIKNLYEKDSKIQNSMDLIERTNMIYQNRSRIWKLTQEGKDALAPFVSREFIKGDPADNNYNWENKALCYEVTETNYINGGFNRITTRKLAINLDINQVLAKMYGTHDEEGHKFFYRMIPMYPLPAYTYKDLNGHQIIQKYMIQIQQADENNVKSLSDELYMGIAGNSGSLHINRPKRDF